MQQLILPRSTLAPPAPPTAPAFVQAASNDSGASAVASLTATLAAPATAGNLLVACANSDATLTAAGWTLVVSAINAQGLYLWHKIAAGGETTATVVPSVADTVAMAILEYTGIAAVSPADQTATANAQGVGGEGPVSAGATPDTLQASELVIAVTGPHSFTTLGVPQDPIWTDGYTARAAAASVYATGAQNSALFVADKVVSATGPQSTSMSWTNSAQDWGAVIATFKGA